MIVILVGMAIAFAVAVYRLSPDLSFEGTLSVAGKMGKLEAVDFSVDPHKRYTFWSGLIGGFFLALSYFGADQSQVQRYLAGGSLKESRLGLLFNAVVKVPMQFFILLLGAIVFMFYQFEKPPVYFNQPAYQRAVESGYGPQLAALQTQFDDVFVQKRAAIRALSSVSSKLSSNERDVATTKLRELDAQAHELRNRTKGVLEQAGADPKSKESDYVFITFILQQMPHGLVGLLIAVILCATMSATSAILNALGSTTAIDFYRPLIRPDATRPSLCRRGESADRGVGFDCHRRRFVCKSGRKSNRSRQHSGLGVLWQHPRSLSGRFLYSSSYRIGRVFRGAPCANARLRPVRYNEYRLPLV